ncbi:LLM class flavin-dependent oxidoreductase [Nakamurella sp. YIM 132087]|uniref:LLM class flavin-dependent oxidoreductase n=1 Tax=Nakamurella alba TaxID=2665158 RepID=A0A7K1FTC5_9ACTN|nr:LLM class flavin-dependent oxidoreductase [Nakamurella alba]MTD16639.1 LLM class flavin-dependent oxidoreductase [Nakamurella alba]
MTFFLSVALTGAGAHPGAWRSPAARPGELTSARYWTDLVLSAERAHLDFVTLEDGFGRDPQRPSEVGLRLDATLLAARIAPSTGRIGIVPAAVTSQTEPFHLSKAIATLDYVSSGRAGVLPQISIADQDYALVGRRAPLPPADAWAEAADWVEVVRRLWDSWEDDAEIRDVATGRFVDIDKLHYVDFAGPYFSVRGPSITPRPPQGQPVVVVAAGREAGDGAIGVAAAQADVAILTDPLADPDAATALAELDGLRAATGGAAQRRLTDLVVFLDDRDTTGADRLAELDDRHGASAATGTAVFSGSPTDLAALLVHRQQAGYDGVRLWPGVLPTDLEVIVHALVPELRRLGLRETEYLSESLRDRLDLPVAPNRYAAVSSDIGALA